MERHVFGRNIPSPYSHGDYGALIKQSLKDIFRQMYEDLSKGEADNDYVTDAHGKQLEEGVQDIEKCGVQCYNLVKKIDKLTWFVGGDPKKILALQQKLNKMGIKGDSGKLEEDGVYGKNTASAWMNFSEKLISGSVPMLGFIDPLQSKATGYKHIIASVKKPSGTILNHYKMNKLPANYSYSVILKNKQRAFMLDRPHYENGLPLDYHMNMEMDVPKRLKKYFYNHKPITEEAYLKLKNFQKIAKPVRMGGRVLLVSGVALDALELYKAIEKDGITSKSAISTSASIGGRWAGATLLDKLGATAGGLTGPYALVAIPVLGLVGGIVGSIGGDALAKWIVDITWAEE